jgi:prepilin-type N-terminal cleavage/methylation domain-containing protein
MKFMNPIATKPRIQSPGLRAFTLIELLVVITIIGVLAGFILVVSGSVAKTKKINTAQAELKEIQSAIENYHAHYGVYPPGNSDGTVAAALTNQLYYELTGVTPTNQAGTVTYQTVDNNTITSTQYAAAFGAAGVLNSTKIGGEAVVPSVNFLPGLKPNRIGEDVPFNTSAGVVKADLLVTSVGGPDDAYTPVGVKGVNPFRYKAPSPTNNNPDSYDLWINISMGATNFSGANNGANRRLISNWSNKASQNSQLP